MLQQRFSARSVQWFPTCKVSLPWPLCHLYRTQNTHTCGSPPLVTGEAKPGISKLKLAQGNRNWGSRGSECSGNVSFIIEREQIIFTIYVYSIMTLQDALRHMWQPRLYFSRDVSWCMLSEFITQILSDSLEFQKNNYISSAETVHAPPPSPRKPVDLHLRTTVLNVDKKHIWLSWRAFVCFF